jgi:hypothetical protein
MALILRRRTERMIHILVSDEDGVLGHLLLQVEGGVPKVDFRGPDYWRVQEGLPFQNASRTLAGRLARRANDRLRFEVMGADVPAVLLDCEIDGQNMLYSWRSGEISGVAADLATAVQEILIGLARAAAAPAARASVAAG